MNVPTPEPSSVAVPRVVVPSRNVIVPVGVPFTPFAVAVSVICDCALDGFWLDCNNTVVPFFTNCEMALEVDGALFVSPG